MKLHSLAVATLLATGAAGADPLIVTPTGGATFVGMSTPVTLTLDLSSPLNLEGITFTMDWDGAGLSFSPSASSAFGRSWSDFNALFDPGLSSSSSDPDSFAFSGILLATETIPAGSPTLSLSFTGLAVGSYPVSYSLDLVNDAGVQFNAIGQAPVSVSAAIPEPSVALLLLAGLSALGWRARRRSR